jgi:ketosteroid isomerase-like protein
MRGMDLDAFQGWLRRYFDAWASNDPVEVSSLFAVDAVYSYGPFREVTRGRDAIVRAWVEGGVPNELRTDVEPIAVSGDRGVAHWRVAFRHDAGGVVELDGILVCDFDTAGRCVLHREWYDRLEPPA